MKNTRSENPDCRVCGSGDTRVFPAGNTTYWRCRNCVATCMDAGHLPGAEAEQRRYESHNNDPDDSGYRYFLCKLAAPLASRLPPGQTGLDFGCGPAPAIPRIMAEYGHDMAVYDPFFFPDDRALGRTYDFVVCTEVVEHFHRPAESFEKLDSLLKSKGFLGIMTCFQTCDNSFENWYYRRDFTHVVFYREKTFRVIASRFGWNCEIPAKDIVLMRKP